MTSFTACDLDSGGKKINAVLLDDGDLIVERSGIIPLEINISNPEDFAGRWLSTRQVDIADKISDVVLISGIRYRRVTED